MTEQLIQTLDTIIGSNDEETIWTKIINTIQGYIDGVINIDFVDLQGIIACVQKLLDIIRTESIEILGFGGNPFNIIKSFAIEHTSEIWLNLGLCDGTLGVSQEVEDCINYIEQLSALYLKNQLDEPLTKGAK